MRPRDPLCRWDVTEPANKHRLFDGKGKGAGDTGQSVQHDKGTVGPGRGRQAVKEGGREAKLWKEGGGGGSWLLVV